MHSDSAREISNCPRALVEQPVETDCKVELIWAARRTYFCASTTQRYWARLSRTSYISDIVDLTDRVISQVG